MRDVSTDIRTDKLPAGAGRVARRRGGLLRDTRGATAVEFAIVAPIFFFLLFLIAETGLIFAAEETLDHAVTESARLIRTGQVQRSGMSQEAFRSDVCGRVAVFMDCNSPHFFLDVKTYGRFADMNMSRPLAGDESFEPEGTYEFGDPEGIVVVRAYYQWPTTRLFGSWSLANLGNGRRLLGTFLAFRNEPYEAIS